MGCARYAVSISVELTPTGLVDPWFRFKPMMLDAVLLTHLHSDHICGLNDVVTTQWVMSPVETPLRIFGPPRTQEVVAGMRAMLQPDVEYRLALSRSR